MPHDEPSWWYRESVSWRAHALQPAASLYGWSTTRRMTRATPFECGLPVICIGNLTAGGSGKTPIAISISQVIEEMGWAPVFLSRGFGGKQRGPLWVDPQHHSARDVGDEPLLLARHKATVVSHNRAAGARLIKSTASPRTVIVMDDGLQNPSLAKSLTVAVVNGTRGIGNARVIPSGPLRAPLEQQLHWLDALVTTYPTTIDSAQLSAMPPGLEAIQHNKPIWHARTAPHSDTFWLSGTPVIAFAAIAHPRRFFDLIAQLGANIRGHATFADHHQFREQEAIALLEAAAKHHAQLVTTEKDQVRMLGATGAVKELSNQARSVAIKVTLDARSEYEFRNRIAQILASHVTNT